MKQLVEAAGPAAFALLFVVCVGLLRWNGVLSALLSAAAAAGIAYAQATLLGSSRPTPQKQKCEKQPPQAEPQAPKQQQPEPTSAPASAPAPAPTEQVEKKQEANTDEPEHFHDNDELAARANVLRDKARKLRDEAHLPENKERKAQLLEEANAEDAAASKMVFEELQKKQPEGTIDLHLQFVADAVRICDEQAALLQAKGAQEMCVIVGKGNHSEGGKCKIAPAIEEWATSKGYRQEPGEGKITVHF